MATPASASLHESYEALRAHLERRLSTARDDPRFAPRLETWADRHGYDALDRSDLPRVAAAQLSLLLLSGTLRDPPGADVDPASVLDTVGSASALGPAVPTDAETRRRVADLVCSGTGVNPSRPIELLSTLYEASLPVEDRRSHGQYYTPPTLARILVDWALPDRGRASPTVLDPGAGSGLVLEAASERLDGLGIPSEDILARLVGVDVDRFALQLAGTALSQKGESGAGPRLYHTSFFDLEPGEPPPSGTRIGAPSDGRPLCRLDAVVGNPPYVRAGELDPDAEHYRAHLSALGPDGQSPYADGDRGISGRSDAYVYFITHATRFLRPGGRLAFVLPTKWLSSAYGEDLMRFLHDHYRVHAVVGFDDRVFPDALIDTCLLLAERCVTERVRDANGVRFVTLGDLDPDRARRVIGTEGRTSVPGGSGRRDGSITRTGAGDRIVLRRQSTVPSAKPLRYLTAPDEVVSLPEQPAFVALGSLATVRRGVMTGANRFFFVDDATVDRWGIEDRFLAPARKSMRGLEGRTFDPDDVDRYVIDVDGYVASFPDGADGDAVKTGLSRDGYHGLRSYIEHAESEGAHRGPTCRNRRVWFHLGPLPKPDVFVPKLLRERVFVIANRAGAVPSNAIDCLTSRDGVDSTVLIGVLESTLCQLAMELWGRDEAGMLQLMTYETKTLPVPDVRSFSPDTRSEVTEATTALLDGTEAARRALDVAVLGATDLELSVQRLRELRERLVRRRVGDRATGQRSE